MHVEQKGCRTVMKMSICAMSDGSTYAFLHQRVEAAGEPFPGSFLSLAVSRSPLRRACLEAFLSFFFFSWLAEAGIWHEGVRQML